MYPISNDGGGGGSRSHDHHHHHHPPHTPPAVPPTIPQLGIGGGANGNTRTLPDEDPQFSEIELTSVCLDEDLKVEETEERAMAMRDFGSTTPLDEDEEVEVELPMQDGKSSTNGPGQEHDHQVREGKLEASVTQQSNDALLTVVLFFPTHCLIPDQATAFCHPGSYYRGFRGAAFWLRFGGNSWGPTATF